MRRRVYDDTHHSYEDYGGRGIDYDPRWMDFEEFLRDMGIRPEGTTLDRIDPDGHYVLSNCRWATNDQQANNKRSSRVLLIGGLPLTIAEWADLVGTPYHTIWQRIRRGWPEVDAICRPLSN